MENRISSQLEDGDRERENCQGPQPIRAILAELLSQYQSRFPEARITVVETPAVAI